MGGGRVSFNLRGSAVSTTRTFERKSGETLSGRRVLMDPRCWRTIYHVRMLLTQYLGFQPSFDYALSELLVDPERGAKMLKAAHEKYGGVSIPRQYCPQGNRYRDLVDANRDQPPGNTRDDWGTE